MSRPYRLQGKNILYHIISRGNDRRKIFLNTKDYQKYLEYLQKAQDKYQCFFYAYVLMSNHVHLLIETSLPNISKVMHYINGSYTTYLNIKRRKSGHLFQGRYKSIVVDRDEYLKELTRYIHLNPVRAKIVKRPEQYLWSSYQAYVSRSHKSFIAKDRLRQYFNLSPSNYRMFVEQYNGEGEDYSAKIYAGFILGGNQFIKETLNLIGDQINRKNISYKDDLEEQWSMDDILGLIAERHKVDIQDLCDGKRKRLWARGLAVYALQRYTGYGNQEIGARFRMSESGVSKMVKSVEERIKKDRGIRGEVSWLNSKLKG
ncbi:transposase [PVC group bacterium]|nr:transposase [PVC group bacterium]